MLFQFSHNLRQINQWGRQKGYFMPEKMQMPRHACRVMCLPVVAYATTCDKIILIYAVAVVHCSDAGLLSATETQAHCRSPSPRIRILMVRVCARPWSPCIYFSILFVLLLRCPDASFQRFPKTVLKWTIEWVRPIDFLLYSFQFIFIGLICFGGAFIVVTFEFRKLISLLWMPLKLVCAAAPINCQLIGC